MKKGVSERLMKELAKEHACFVLITCGKPSEEGDMQVELKYEGDLALAAYLIQGAQNYMDEQQDDCFATQGLGSADFG